MKNIILLALLLLTSFQINAQDTLASVQQSLLGTWEWQKTIHSGHGGSDTTAPETCYCSMELLLVKDNRMKFTYTGSSSTGAYEVRISEIHKDQIWFLFTSEKLSGRLYFVNRDEIIVSRGACGTSSYYYKRKL